MTEREKMLRGELYDSSDNELEQLRLHARKLARRYNLTDEDQQEVQTQILRNYCRQQKSFRICRHRSILIMDVILTSENIALLILISHA